MADADMKLPQGDEPLPKWVDPNLFSDDTADRTYGLKNTDDEGDPSEVAINLNIQSGYSLLKSGKFDATFATENTDDLNVTNEIGTVDSSKAPKVFDQSIVTGPGISYDPRPFPSGATPLPYLGRGSRGTRSSTGEPSGGAAGLEPSGIPNGFSVAAGNSARILVTPEQLKTLWQYSKDSNQVQALDSRMYGNSNCGMLGNCLGGVAGGFDAARINFFVDVDGVHHDQPMGIHAALAPAAARHASKLAWAKDATTLFRNNGALELANGFGTFPEALKNMPDGTVFTFDGTINAAGGDGKVCGHIIEKAGMDKNGNPVLICDGKAVDWHLAGYANDSVMRTRGEWHAWWVPGLTGTDGQKSGLQQKLADAAAPKPTEAPAPSPGAAKLEKKSDGATIVKPVKATPGAHI